MPRTLVTEGTSAVIVALALAGLLAGWGQRAIVVRYAVPAGDPPRAECPSCGQRFPRGGWLLGPFGRCRACGQRTGPPPLAIGAVTAITLAALAARVHPVLVLAAASWLALFAVPLAFIDAAVQRLPDLLTAPAYGGTILLLLLAAVTGGTWQSLTSAMFGGAALAGLCLVLAVISPSGMGLGDAKLAAGLGTLLAWSGWRTLFAGTLAGFVLAALYGIALLVTGRATRKEHIPFGPFLIAGAFLVVLTWHL